MQEVFKDVNGFEGFYQISNLGRVKSLITNKFLNQENSKSKRVTYKRVKLHKNGYTKRYLVHRLVAIHFIENPGNKAQVNHIDNNTHNNLVGNLEWCTPSENMAHSRAQGRQDKVTELAAKAMAKSNLYNSKVKYDALINTSINGRTLLSYSRGIKAYKGVFKCDNCGRIFTAELDASLRNASRELPTYCRYCMIKRVKI